MLLVYFGSSKQKLRTLQCCFIRHHIENAPHLITVHNSKNPKEYIYSKPNYP